ncbi:LysR family transcriptional regulator [Caulobacter endophyticus]|uniref:LysR family transcriptional regulator n=1 Tax=Caulobacter endophyticus TaxID=2172652 RepID=UPI00241048AA|nr:LysR family transcriptional regulator [Caulobacter endophyticus]MDG2527129.1 LysR family transcriptional regulator [Caulobacter endophyticus]
MPDLNDYLLYAEVVAHGGFAPAGRALRQPKSTLSRRIAQLEARLGVRLIERTTRRFRVTEVGQAFYERCRIVALDVEQANAVAAEAKSEPQGLIRFSCPTGLVETLSASLPRFLARFPKVRLQVIAVDRAVDLIEERIDVALRVRTVLTTDAALTMRTLGRSRRILVTGPQLAARCADLTIDQLAGLPTLSPTDQSGELTWDLLGPDGATCAIRHEPRMACGDFLALRDAAAANIGVAFLPDHVCKADLVTGRLVQVFPEWRSEDGIVHIVFTTRRGLPPAVRAFIDHLAAVFSQDRPTQ